MAAFLSLIKDDAIRADERNSGRQEGLRVLMPDRYEPKCIAAYARPFRWKGGTAVFDAR